MVEDEVVIVVGGEVESEPFSGVWDIFADSCCDISLQFL